MTPKESKSKSKRVTRESVKVTVRGPKTLKRISNKRIQRGAAIVFDEGVARVTPEVAEKLAAEYPNLTIEKE